MLAVRTAGGFLCPTRSAVFICALGAKRPTRNAGPGKAPATWSLARKHDVPLFNVPHSKCFEERCGARPPPAYRGPDCTR